MANRPNKAMVDDAAMGDAFRQGFEEGVVMAATAQVVYEFTVTFEGTDLRRARFSDLEVVLREAHAALLNGGGVTVVIAAVAVPAAQVQEQKAVAASDEDSADIVDAEVVETTEES